MPYPLGDQSQTVDENGKRTVPYITSQPADRMISSLGQEIASMVQAAQRQPKPFAQSLTSSEYAVRQK